LISSENYIFQDRLVLLGTRGVNQIQKPVRIVGYKIAGSKYYVATDLLDITADQVAAIYKLR